MANEVQKKMIDNEVSGFIDDISSLLTKTISRISRMSSENMETVLHNLVDRKKAKLKDKLNN